MGRYLKLWVLRYLIPCQNILILMMLAYIHSPKVTQLLTQQCGFARKSNIKIQIRLSIMWLRAIKRKVQSFSSFTFSPFQLLCKTTTVQQKLSTFPPGEWNSSQSKQRSKKPLTLKFPWKWQWNLHEEAILMTLHISEILIYIQINFPLSPFSPLFIVSRWCCPSHSTQQRWWDSLSTPF